jgi:hypothetical protein
MIAKRPAESGRTVYVRAAPVRRAQCLVSGTGLAGAFRLKRPERCPVRILWVYHPRHGFSGEQIRIETHAIIIDSIPMLISNGKAEVIYGKQ